MKMERSIGYRCLMMVCALALLVCAGIMVPSDAGSAGKQPGKLAAASGEWIIQWRQDPPVAFLAESRIIREYPASHVTVAMPLQPLGEEEWLARWKESPLVESVSPNQKVKAARAPNDPLLPNQHYLKQIRAEEAWDVVTGSDLIIAVVDTGVDRSHPDLEDKLVPGINLIENGAYPDDDNGHGTNVAGVIAAAADNDKGTAGLLWNAQIMPIKALEADGNGDEDKLGEGIRYAVHNGARIVVLSLGLNKRSAYMEQIVAEAELAGVLLVAASGNEGDAVKYPAAYDTVLAVGGVGPDNARESLSNYGPELDIAAPWIVFTTVRGGAYEYRDGTSMAAPQAAAAAALAWSTHQALSPAELRNLLKQTAQDLGPTGWDQETGYGLLRVDRAVREELKRDIYEPNNRQNAAKPISSNKSIAAYLEQGDEDWFYWEAPYDGYAQYKLSGTAAELAATHVTEGGTEVAEIRNPSGNAVPVKKGRHYVRITGAAPSPYSLEVNFRIYEDPFEDNDRQYKAYTLPSRSQLLVGTFSHNQDQDWFSLPVDQPGTLRLKVTPDTSRMDPVLTFMKKGGKELVIDHNGDGELESYQAEVTPGLYYIRVSNLASYTYPIVGEYILDIHLATSYEDPFEPNNRSYQATTLTPDENYLGVIDPDTDVDWYRFKLEGESSIHVEFNLFPDSEGVSLQLLDGTLKEISMPVTPMDRDSWGSNLTLPAGTYYIKANSSAGVRQQLYSLQLHVDRLIEGFSDIYGHWAEPVLSNLVRKGYIDGYGGRNLYPDRPITRAEAAAMLDRALRLQSGVSPGFADLPQEHWAYPAVARLYKAGIVRGVSAVEFAPDRSITRMEMLSMLANATNRRGTTGFGSPFPDVNESYWGISVLRQMKDEGWAEGYPDGTFRPERSATRAEWMHLAARMLKL
ncbi:S8 family serine peptidase [Paenibacillus sp. YN15]|uniref:S8 family serine peptidase n=1 Tax=Paenibacillus sp. YN15 TaxID=1742774 RepID=UPI0015EB3044|nr:S8 family serine peptidase [Paenibacillus sp. YN15]